MAQQFRPWAENDDIRDQAEASLEQGQQQIAAQEDASLTTRQQQWNLNEEKRRAYEDQVRAAEQRRQQPGISPQAWEAASRTLSGEDRASALAAARQAELQARQDQSLLEDSAIRLQQQEIDRQAEQERLAAAQEREQAAQDAIATRQHRAAGGATHTDPVTGRSTITRHEDGAPAFDAGPVGDPRVEEARTRSDFAAGILGGSGDGALGATGGTQAKATGVQDFLDDRGNVATLPIEEKTDPATGETYVETKDQFGRPKRLTTGTDQKVKRTLQLDLEYDQLQAVRGNLELQAQQIAPNYQAAADAFAAAQRKYNVAPKYVMIAGEWVENSAGIPTDPDEQRKWVQTQIPADPIKLAAWQRERQMDRQAYEIAKRNHDKAAPAWNNLQQQIETAKSREAQIRVAKKRLALGLPEDDGGLAESLVALEDGTVTTREQAVNAYLADLPADTRARLARGLDPKIAATEQPASPADEPEAAATEIPAIPQDDPAAVELFKSAFAPIPGAESLTIGETGKTYRTLRRDGTTIGAIYTDPENPERPFIALNAYAGSDLAPRVNLDAADGLRVYLQENIRNRPSPTKEDAWAAGVYATLLDPALKEDEQAQNEYLRQQQATPTDLINRVRQGEVSVQVGSRMLRDLYGIELTTGDYNDPALFQKWLQEESARQLREDVWLPQDTVAAKWQRATKDRLSLSEQENIRNDYAAHYVLTNPLLTRDQQKALYAQNARHDASTMDRVRSFVNATKKFAAEDVFGSSIGIVAGIGEDLSYAGASALSESARETLAEKMRLRGMSTAAWAQGVERFAKTLATKEGREAAAQRDLAMREWQAAVDAAHGQPEPDQAAIDAAKQKAIAATLRLHNLARDEGSPIEAHHLDPAQDRALRMAMDRYVATADPRAWASLDARMLMSNDRRWVSAEMEELAGGQGGFLGAVNRARYAGFEEVGSEALSWFTLGAYGFVTKGGKIANAAMKGNRTWQAYRTGKLAKHIITPIEKAVVKLEKINNVAARILSPIEKAAVKFDNLGKAAGTLQKPLTRAQRAGNAMLRGGKIVAIGGGTEGLEEVFVELGADDPQLLKTFALGAAGGVMMLPIGVMQAGIGGAVASHQQQARLQQRYAEYAREYNRINRDIPGFEDIDAKTAEFASLFVNSQEREAGLQQLSAEMSGIQEFLAIENSAQAAGQTPGPEVTAMEQRLASLEAVSTSLAEMDVAAIDAVSGFAKLDAQEKTNLVAYAKAAAGRADLLTPQERKAIQAKNTEAGAPVFQGDTVTPEGMAMLVEQYPVLGKLPQFQAAAQQAQDVAPLAGDQAAQSGDSSKVVRYEIDAPTQQRANTVSATVAEQVVAQYPGLASIIEPGAPSNPAQLGGGVEMAFTEDGPRIRIVTDDIAQQIAMNPGVTDEQIVQSLVESVAIHETAHVAQENAAVAEADARGITGTRIEKFKAIYTERAAEYQQNKEVWQIGAELYGRNSVDGADPLAGWAQLSPWAQAAEIERMFAESILTGNTTDALRFMSASFGKVKEYLKTLAAKILAYINGELRDADGNPITPPPAIVTRARQIADAVQSIQQGTNATPDPNPSRPNPADNPSQPAPGQPGAGNRQSAEKDGNRRPPGDGRTGQTPVDDTGASAQSAEEIAQAAAKEEYDRTLAARPLLKKDLELMSALRTAAMEAREAATADPQNAERIVKDAIGKFLLRADVAERLAELNAEQRTKARAYRAAAQARVDAEAARVMQGNTLLAVFDFHGFRIKGPPRDIGLIRDRVKAAKEAGQPVNPDDQSILDEFDSENYAGMPTAGDYPGGGKNAVARAIIAKLYTRDGSGQAPDELASDSEINRFGIDKGSELHEAIANSLREYVNGPDTSNLTDPNADTSGMTDEQIEQLLEREARAQNLSRWKGITRREGLTSSTADAYQAELATLADAAGHSLDEGGNVVDAFGDFIPPEDLAALQQQAIATVDERNAPKPKTETREDLDKVQTDGSTAALNPRVEGLEDQSVSRGDLSGKTQPLSTAALQAIQRNGAGITAPPTDGPLKKAVDAFAAKAQAMMPMFQGNKVQMAKYVASAILRYWTKAQREAVTTFYDLFAGGGAWGLVLADTFFPNVKKFVINEFDTPRSIKVREQMVNGHRFAEVIQNKDTQIIIRGILQDYYARAKGVTWGGIYVQFEKWAEQNAGKFDDTTVAIIKMLADDSTLGAPASWGTLQEEIGKELDGRPVMQRRGPNAEEVTKWFLGRHAKWAETIHQTYQRMVDRGVDFTFRNGDAYTMDVDRGRHVFVTADPPYFATTGYDDSIVGPGMYASTRDLMRRLTGQDNNVAYTDEAWWIKDSINDKITDADLVEGAEIATQIAKTLDFMVVAGKIESRYETLGLHNPAGSPVAPGRTANPDGNAVRPDGGNLQQEGRGPDGRGTAGDVAAGTVAEARLQPAAADLKNLPVGTVVRSKAYASEGNITIEKPLAPRADGTPAYQAGTTGGRVFTITPDQITSVVSTPGPTTLGSAPVQGRNGRPAIQTTDGRTLEAPGAVLMSPAYHGTPHKIDPREGFRLDRIGTGEGAQAYGWGLYFAESMGVAKSYVSAGKNESARNLIALIQEESAYYVPSKKWYGKQLSREESDVELAKNFFKKYLKQFPNTKVTEEVILDVIKSGIDNVNPEIFGNLYKVDLKPAEDEYLDWDKPLSEQSEKVLNAIRRIPADLAIDLLDAPGFYKNEAVVWARKMGWIDAGITNPEGASKYLHALGIRGIRYLDGNSRNRPLRDIKRDFLNALPENAEFEDVAEAIQDGAFNPQQVAFLDALKADDWLGFDYPAQAISAALSGNIGNWDPSQTLIDSIAPLRGDVTYNYVIFDEADIEITEENGRPVQPSAVLGSAPVQAPDMRPLTPDRLWGEWAASTTEPGILIGYRGENGNGKADNGFGSSEGVGLYLAKTEEDTAFFGKAREVKFPKPKRPLIVDEQAGVEALPLLDEESPVWPRIFSHQPRPGDSDWIKAHTLAAKQIGLTEDTWVEKIDAFPRALTDKLLAMGYDAVYTRSGGMEWVTILAKPGQRFNRGTRSERGTALYSAPAQNPAAQYRYLKDKEAKAGLTPAEQQALLRAEQAMGQTFAIDMDDPSLRTRRGSVSPSFQPQLNLETQHPITGRQLSLFSAPAQSDPEYLAAVEAGDMGTAQRMVDEAAKKAGYDSSRALWRGDSQAWSVPTGAVYLTEDKYLAEYFRRQHARRKEVWGESDTTVIRRFYARAGMRLADEETIIKGKPLRTTSYLHAPYARQESVGDMITAADLLAEGYDGARGEMNGGDYGDIEILVIAPSNIKSADPVTYDAQGNVIPLSQRFNPESDSILYSPAAQPDDQAALEAALRGLDPIYGDVLKASMESPTPSPEALAARFNIPVRAVHNILGTVRARIQAQARTIRPGGLQPQRTEDGRLKGGMPQRGNSTVPHLAAVDQLQQQEGLPLSKTNREIHDAGRRLAARPDALDHLLAAQRSGAPTAEQIAATAHYLREASVRGDQSAKLTELAILYREQGTRQSEEFRARIDQYHTPSERNALIFQEMLTAPNKKVRKAYEDAKTPEAKLAILEAWNAKVKGIKEAMKNRGIDLDAALARLAEQRANVQAGEAYASEAHQKLVDSLNAEVASLRQQLAAAQEGPAKDAAQAKLDTAEQNAAKAAELDPRNTIRLELEKLRPDERAVIETLRETQDWATAAARGFMDIRDVKRLVDRFQDAIATAGMQAILLAEDILLDRQATLQAPAANAPDRVKEAFRLAMAMTKVATGIDPDAINRKAAGKPPKSTRQKKADAGPEPAMMTDEQFAAYQANPQTWRPLWQAEAALTGQRLTFEEWQARPETQALKQRQERMFKQPVSTFTGELDMQDPISVKRAFDALNIHSASLFDKAMEFWRTSILSGPQTAIVNFGGNVAHSLYQLGPRRILEAGVNDVLGIIGLGSKDAATMGELRVMAKQVHKALGKAGSDMLRSWNMDDRVVEAEVLALGKQVEFSGVGADYSPQAMGGPIGSIMRGISFRHMTASDEFLKSFHAHVEVAAHAYRMAKAEGLKGDAMEARMEELMKYGSQAWQRAYNSAEWVTFQSRPDQSDRRAISFLDRFAKGIRRFAQTDTGRTKEIVKIDRDGKLRREVVPIMRPNAFSFFFPFINTPLNIFKIGIEMSPIGAFFSLVDASRALRERLDKGHLTPQAAKAAAAELYDKQRLVQDITNQLISAGLFWALGTLVKPDDEDELPFITGSVDWKRTSRGDRDVRQRVMPAYSIRIGDAIFSYQRVEPFGTALGFLVDARLAFEKNGATDAALGEFMTTAINQMDNKTYLQGVSDIFNLIHDPSRFGSKVAGNLATGFVPNLIRQPIREADPYVRDTRPAAEDGFMEAIAKRIGYSLAPGYAPPMLDVWGNPLLRNPGAKLLGSSITDIPLRVFDPTQLTVAKEIDPIDRYIFNWNNSQADQKARFNIEPIRDTLTITRNGTTHKVAISVEDHLQANRNAGQAARAVLGNDWNPVTPTEQGIERIKDVVRTFQKRERDRLRAKYAATLPAE